MLSLSVVMPAYNEAASIVDAVDDVHKHVFSTVPDSELIIVDDGSTDDTPHLIVELQRKMPNLKLVRQKNSGHGQALINGLDKSMGEALLLLDSDRQISLAQFAEHWTLFKEEDYGGILGVRKPRYDPFHRLIVTRLMRLLILLTFGIAPQDAGVPYKLVKREIWSNAANNLRKGCWIPSVLLAIFLLRIKTDKVIEIPVKHSARAHGPSSLNFRKLLRFCLAAAQDVIEFRKIVNLKT